MCENALLNGLERLVNNIKVKMGLSLVSPSHLVLASLADFPTILRLLLLLGRWLRLLLGRWLRLLIFLVTIAFLVLVLFGLCLLVLTLLLI